MKKVILSLLLMSTVIILAGCGNKEEVNVNADGQTAATVNKDASGTNMNFKEKQSTDGNGNPVIERTFQDGRIETEVHEGNKVIRTNKHPDGKTDKSIEEFLGDGTRVMTHTDPEGRIHKFSEKDLGNGKRQMKIENQLPDGSFEIIDEIHEHISDGKDKSTRKFQDGRVQEMLMTHDGNQDKNETITKYPDGRVEKTTEEFFHQPDGTTKLIRTNPDGSTEENIITNDGGKAAGTTNVK